MTFEYRDAYGRVLTVAHGVDDDDNPVAVLWVRGEYSTHVPVRVPADRVEEVVAGIRDAARTASGQQPEPTVAPPADDLPDRLCDVLTERFTELGNPFSEMRIQFKGPDGWPASKPVGPNAVAEVLRELLAAPAVGQPAEAQATDEARPPRVQWRVEGYDADEWNPLTELMTNHDAAPSRRSRIEARYPSMPTRVVRETTTWTVEDER